MFSLVYLRSCWTAVEPLVPGCPSSCFPPLLLTVLRPFLLRFTPLLSFLLYLYFSSSCPSGGNGAGSKQTQQQRQHYSSVCFVVANMHHNNPGQVHPNTVNFTSRNDLRGSSNTSARFSTASAALNTLKVAVVLRQ